jgi:hypothetical protein
MMDNLVKWPWYKFRFLRMWKWAEEENLARRDYARIFGTPLYIRVEIR